MCAFCRVAGRPDATRGFHMNDQGSEARREEMLDRIAEAARDCQGSTSNPRYFAEMLVSGLTSNAKDELESFDLANRLLYHGQRLQRRRRAREAAAWAERELAETRL